MSTTRGLAHSIWSGFFASTGGLAGKVAFDEKFIQASILRPFLGIIFDQHNLVLITHITQGLVIVLMVLANLLMFRSFNRALQACQTTLEASIVNTASNFLFTAAFGQLLFDEYLSQTWWIGTVLIIIGTFLVGLESSSPKTTKTD